MEIDQQTVISNIKLLKAHFNYNQNTLAKKSGVARGTLEKVESGAALPSKTVVTKLAEFFGYDAEAFASRRLRLSFE